MNDVRSREIPTKGEAQRVPEGAGAAAPIARDGNIFGFLRLFFAVSVIVSHSPELIDGNRTREPLTLVFHTLSLGEIAVAGFFLISGFLITRSYMETGSWAAYFAKRVLRIVPGFVVAFLISWLVVGPLAGGHIRSDGYGIQLLRLMSLQAPELRDAFEGLPFPLLNGPMFTIAFEFRCYIFLLILGGLGIIKSRKVYVSLLFVFAGLFLLDPPIALPSMIHRWVGVPLLNFKFLMIFMCGGAFYLFREHIRYTPALLAMAAVALFALMFVSPDIAQIALATVGGYLLFWFALHVDSAALRKVGSKVDLSYGCYLYAWPVQNLIIQYHRDISPWLLTPVTIVVAAGLGYLSWRLVEAPFLRLKPVGARRMALPSPHMSSRG